MIAFVEGELTAFEESAVLVNCGGVGYRIFTPMREETVRLGIGSQVRFYTYLNVREDAMLLYGFPRTEQLTLFKQLINVNSVGPKSALAIMTTLSYEELLMAIASGNEKALSAVSGVGAKTAARIILDLKDKVAPVDAEDIPNIQASQTKANAEAEEAVMALTALGFKAKEAQSALDRVFAAAPDLREADAGTLVKAALKLLR